MAYRFNKKRQELCHILKKDVYKRQLLKALKLDEVKDKKVYRISFNEITKNAVKTSLKEPRAIDMNLVDAQQARRCLLYTSRCV